ncbi:MAG: class I SAM-dependent methyltransferase, partial [Bdellovibrionales bacterium]
MKDLHAPDIRNFIRQNETADIAALALKKPPDPNWPYPHILDQIKARQKAKTKIPQWLDNDDIIFPQPDVIEQASSSATANYKASLVTGKSFCDLTGGAGVDSWALLQSGFERGAIIDANPKTAKVLQHNFKALTTKDVHVHPVRAE